MATTLEQYANAYLTLNSTLVSEATSVTVRRMSGSSDVVTMAKGYAGESPGAKRLEIDVESAVPTADFEIDPGKYMKYDESVEIGIIIAGRQLKTRGYILEDSIRYAANAEAALSFKFRGKYADFE